MNWFSKSWWVYLLAKPCSWSKFWCRASGHEAGPVWYNNCGIEPNMNCKTCGDDLG